MGSINGLKNIHATSIQNAGQFYLGNNLDSGTAGQVIISAGPQQAALWGSNSATLPGALTMGTNLSLASGNSSFDGTTADTINADGLNITGGNGISVVGGTEIVTDNDNITINNTGGTGQKNQVLKVPNALTFTGASTGTFDGSSALSINLTNTDTQLNLTGALPIVINDLGGLNKQVDIDIDSNTMGVSGGELEVLKVPNTLTFTGYATGSFDGSSSLSINLVDTDTTYTAGNGIQISGSNRIQTKTDNQTIRDSGGGSGNNLQVIKVPNVMTAGTNISMVNTDDGASASSYDGSEPITINAASSGTTYDGGTNINIDTSTTPDEINLDTSITGQTGITFLNSGASTNLTGSNYSGKPTTATNLDLTDTSNIISPYFLHDVYDPSSTTGQSLTTSYVQIFSGNLKNTFTAKATSCCIEIIVMSYTLSANRWLYLQLADNKGTEWSAGSYSDGGGTGTGTRDTQRLVHYPDETDRQIVIQTWYLQGLTIGNTYTINPQAKTSSTTNQLWTGGIWPACICRGYYLPS